MAKEQNGSFGFYVDMPEKMQSLQELMDEALRLKNLPEKTTIGGRVSRLIERAAELDKAAPQAERTSRGVSKEFENILNTISDLKLKDETIRAVFERAAKNSDPNIQGPYIAAFAREMKLAKLAKAKRNLGEKGVTPNTYGQSGITKIGRSGR